MSRDYENNNRAMYDILSSLNDIETNSSTKVAPSTTNAGTGTDQCAAGDIPAMVNLMESLNDIDDSREHIATVSTVSDHKLDIPAQLVHQSSDEFHLTEHKVKGFKLYTYDVCLAGKIIIEGIMMKEAATTIRNRMNKGDTISSNVVLHLLSEGLNYTRLMKKAIVCKKIASNGKLNENVNSDAKRLLNEAKKCRSDVRNFILDNELL